RARPIDRLVLFVSGEWPAGQGRHRAGVDGVLQVLVEAPGRNHTHGAEVVLDEQVVALPFRRLEIGITGGDLLACVTDLERGDDARVVRAGDGPTVNRTEVRVRV